jgi:hypothetical protein
MKASEEKCQRSNELGNTIEKEFEQIVRKYLRKADEDALPADEVMAGLLLAANNIEARLIVAASQAFNKSPEGALKISADALRRKVISIMANSNICPDCGGELEEEEHTLQ